MNTIDSLLDNLAKVDGYTSSFIPGVSFFRSTESLPRAQLMYESRIIIVGRGEKTGHLNGKVLHYNADNYLVLSIPMPFECEAKENVLALVIDIDLKLLGEVVSAFSSTNIKHQDVEEAVNAIPLKHDLEKSVKHLLEVAHSEEESNILGKSILKEILYRVLKDSHGGVLFALYEENGKFSRFAQLIHKVNSNIESQYSLDKLAQDMVMSKASLNRYFKKFTSQSPLTYIKNIKLQRAKEMILQRQFSIKEVSKKVGYKSVSQFSREFHRYFGVTPKQAQK